jgi:L-gulonate 5-dehydrogenase
MKAAVLKEYGRIEIEERKIPEYSDNELLIQVKYASICGSDQHIYKGEFHPRTKLPLVPGHEFAGIVAAKGKSAEGFAINDKVVVDPIIPCGDCPACKRNHFPACSSLKLVGIDLDGGFSEYISVNAKLVYKVPENVSLESAALVELLSIGFHASSRAQVSSDDSLVIWGAGKVGQAILHAAKTITKGQIFMVDILEKRLALVKKTFPDIHAINAKTTDAVEYIHTNTGGNGVDIAFEAIGHFKELEGKPNPVRSCIKSIRGGGKVCVLGLSDEPTNVLFKELIWKEATIISSRVSHGEYIQSLKNLETGKLDPKDMITSVVDLENANAAFEALEKDPENNLKILLKF